MGTRWNASLPGRRKHKTIEDEEDGNSSSAPNSSGRRLAVRAATPTAAGRSTRMRGRWCRGFRSRLTLVTLVRHSAGMGNAHRGGSRCWSCYFGGFDARCHRRGGPRHPPRERLRGRGCIHRWFWKRKRLVKRSGRANIIGWICYGL